MKGPGKQEPSRRGTAVPHLAGLQTGKQSSGIEPHITDSVQSLGQIILLTSIFLTYNIGIKTPVPIHCEDTVVRIKWANGKHFTVVMSYKNIAYYYTFIHSRKCTSAHYESVPVLDVDVLVIKIDHIPALMELRVFYYLGWKKKKFQNLQWGKSWHFLPGSCLKKRNGYLVLLDWVHLFSNTKKNVQANKQVGILKNLPMQGHQTFSIKRKDTALKSL